MDLHQTGNPILKKQNQKFKKFNRIHTDYDFAAFKQSRQNPDFHNPYFQILCKPNSFSYAKMAVIVPKKIIPKANQRNSIKRLVRETFRKLALHPMDYLIIARKYSRFAKKPELTSTLELSLSQLSEYEQKIEQLNQPQS